MYRTITRLLGVALTTTLLAALPMGADASAPATAGPDPVRRAGPGYHQPAPGSCHEITLKHFYARTAPSRSVDCDERHTSVTLVSKRLKGKVDWNALDVFRPIFLTCIRKTLRVLGGDDKARAMSAYEMSLFIPTRKERAHGAKWLRCDLALQGGRVLQPLPKSSDLGRLPLNDKVARCEAGPVSDLRTTVCSKSHSFRATGAFKVYSRTYPGPQRFAQLAQRRCPKLTTTRRWLYDPPGSDEVWAAGRRTVVCFSKTKK